jgi:predicted nucleic acid-binding protein
LITAVDTNVLLDLFINDPKYGSLSKEALRKCLSEGMLLACEVVFAEVGAFFANDLEAEAAFSRLGMGFSPIEMPVAFSASQVWKKYRRRGGRRLRILPDCLIGAHAMKHAERLLTRDSKFFRRHFPSLTILDPSAD